MMRTFDLDFIYFDIGLTAVWMLILWRKNRRLPIVFGLMGFVVYLIFDYGIWYSLLHTRVFYELPTWLNPFTFLLYFSFTYGMVQFSYVTLILTEQPDRNEIIFFSALLYVGWLAIGLASQLIPMDDAQISIARIMTAQRGIQAVAVAVEYLVLLALAQRGKIGLTFQRVVFIFAVGVFVHFSMESTLLIVGVRNFSLFDLLFDSLLEFNTGAPVLYILGHYARQFMHARADLTPGPEGPATTTGKTIGSGGVSSSSKCS
ncbi:MAG: hypothetical protein HXY34_03660 [Candidatus Thorarchaeota archaeon]|nr:hypothetical protein [Candidatus Thorarchaeota archaeon]